MKIQPGDSPAIIRLKKPVTLDNPLLENLPEDLKPKRNDGSPGKNARKAPL